MKTILSSSYFIIFTLYFSLTAVEQNILCIAFFFTKAKTIKKIFKFVAKLYLIFLLHTGYIQSLVLKLVKICPKIFRLILAVRSSRVFYVFNFFLMPCLHPGIPEFFYCWLLPYGWAKVARDILEDLYFNSSATTTDSKTYSTPQGVRHLWQGVLESTSGTSLTAISATAEDTISTTATTSDLIIAPVKTEIGEISTPAVGDITVNQTPTVISPTAKLGGPTFFEFKELTLEQKYEFLKSKFYDKAIEPNLPFLDWFIQKINDSMPTDVNPAGLVNPDVVGEDQGSVDKVNKTTPAVGTITTTSTASAGNSQTTVISPDNANKELSPLAEIIEKNLNSILRIERESQLNNHSFFRVRPFLINKIDDSPMANPNLIPYKKSSFLED